MGFSLKDAGGAAWRGRYLYFRGHQLGRVVLSPRNETGNRPHLTVAVPVGWYTSCAGIRCVRLASVRMPLPYVPWRWCMATRYARPVVALYQLSTWFWCRMDGRYGWAGSCRQKGAR